MAQAGERETHSPGGRERGPVAQDKKRARVRVDKIGDL